MSHWQDIITPNINLNHLHPIQDDGYKKCQKRKATVEDTEVSVDLEEGWVAKLLELPGDELAKLIGDIANHEKIKIAAIKNARISLPSFSGVKWQNFAEAFGRFERVVAPVYRLPPSVHEIMFAAAWHTQDVYQERRDQSREAARVRAMDPVRL